MNAKIISLLFPLIMFASLANAQGFAGLGVSVEGFATPTPGKAFIFPTDHGPHPEYRIEWWYLTANLHAEDGTAYGLQWTLFRSALAPTMGEGWSSSQMWLGHAAVTTPNAHYVSERFARGGIGQAGVNADPFEAWIDDWSLEGADFSALSMRATGSDFAYEMQLRAQGPIVFHGDDGYSVKSGEGQASYYYSQPFYDIAGTLFIENQEISVTGNAWLDREWSSQPLSTEQTGWDWFSLSFNDGSKLMGFRVRQGTSEGFTYASWVDPNGTLTPHENGAFSADPLTTADVAGRHMPVEWRVTLPARDLDITVVAINSAAWMDVSLPYWEGPVRVSGSHSGVGYLEMTGYE